MAIIRKPMQSKQFTKVPNHWTRDPRLSPAGLGLLTYICSHADSYNLTVKQMLAEHPKGITAIRSAIRECEKLGYLVRHQQRRGGKFAEYDYEIVEFPQVETGVRFSDDGSSADGKSTTKKTTREKTKEEDHEVKCPTSARFAPSGGDDDERSTDSLVDDPWADPWAVVDENTGPRADWRAEDRNLFYQLVGDGYLESSGLNQWRKGTYPINSLYVGLRMRGKDWPGRYLNTVNEKHSGLESWLDNQGFELLPND